MGRRVLGAVALASALAAAAQAGLTCPDDRARELYAMAKQPSGADVEAWMRTYRYVIEQATRPMDDRALNLACSRLAQQLHRAGYTGPEYADDRPPLTDLRGLIEAHPILERCPRYAINTDQWLPYRRVWATPSRAVIDGAITGWVRLALTIDPDGNVEDAEIRWSSHPLLEASALASVMQFKFKPKLDEDGEAVRADGVMATHAVDYWSLARLSGCEPD
jgi:TonB family protein